MAVRKVLHSRGTSYEVTLVVDGRVVRRRYPTRKQALDGYAQLRQSGRDGTPEAGVAPSLGALADSRCAADAGPRAGRPAIPCT